MSNVLVIRAELTCPPTWFASYRDLTLFCHVILKFDIVLEAETPDPYYRWVKARGGMDFVEDIVSPWSQAGISLDIRDRRRPTVVTDRIAPENCHRLIGSIRSLAA